MFIPHRYTRSCNNRCGMAAVVEDEALQLRDVVYSFMMDTCDASPEFIVTI